MEGNIYVYNIRYICIFKAYTQSIYYKYIFTFAPHFLLFLHYNKNNNIKYQYLLWQEVNTPARSPLPVFSKRKPTMKN